MRIQVDTTKVMKKNPEDLGRKTDTVVGHLTNGEVVVPVPIANDPAVQTALKDAFKRSGSSVEKYTVGSPKNRKNPDTGYPEFFWTADDVFQEHGPLKILGGIVAENQKRREASAAAPPPPAPAAPAPQLQPNDDDGSKDKGTAAKRKGRRRLRIDPRGFSVSGEGSGLNIPM